MRPCRRSLFTAIFGRRLTVFGSSGGGGAIVRSVVNSGLAVEARIGRWLEAGGGSRRIIIAVGFVWFHLNLIN